MSVLIDNQPSVFNSYPALESELLQPAWKGSNCRHEYGWDHIRLTKQDRCAYCEKVYFLKELKDWFTMALDHVIPVSVCKSLEIDMTWCRSTANAVLACSTCNTLCNRYVPLTLPQKPESFQEFLKLRNAIFLERKRLIQDAQSREEKVFREQQIKFAALKATH